MTRPAIKSSLSDSAGGYLVPAPLADTIFMNIANKSAVIPFLQKIPMSSATLRMNALDDDVVMTWVDGEGGAKTVSNESHRQITLTAYELAVIVKITDILLEDANISMDALIREEIENALLQALEQSYLGYFAATPFAQTISGSCPAAHTIAYGTGDDLLIDISDALSCIEVDGFTDNIGFVTHPAVMAMLRNLRDDYGQPLFQPANAANPATLFGHPIRFTRNMTSQDSPAGYELIVADWKYMFEGVRNDLRLKKSTDAVVGDDNMFTENKTAVKAWIRRGFAIRDVNAIAKVVGLGV
jgi:HK97 family phage major capsid protein